MQNAELKWRLVSAFCILHSAFAVGVAAQVIDDFDKTVDWQPHPSDGVSLIITQDPAGHMLAAMRLDFDFHGRAGYAIARKNVSIDLPPDYEFSFWIRGNAQPNNLEVKLIESSGENVGGVNQRNCVFRRERSSVGVNNCHFAS